MVMLSVGGERSGRDLYLQSAEAREARREIVASFEKYQLWICILCSQDLVSLGSRKRSAVNELGIIFK